MTKDAKFDRFLPCIYATGRLVGIEGFVGKTREPVYRRCTNPAKGEKVRCARCADNISFVRRGHWPFSDEIDKPSCPYFRGRVRNTL